MIEIIPSILEPNEERFIARYRTVSRFCSLAQLDVLDNSFLPYADYADPIYIDRLKPRIKLEIHLMVAGVERAIAAWNYPWVSKIIFHAEAAPNHKKYIDQIRSQGMEPSIAIDPDTPFAAIEQILPELATIQVMTVNPGRNGAPFLPAALSSIRKLHQSYPQLAIEVDGGITPDTARACYDAGASIFVVGSFLAAEHFEKRMKALKLSL